MESSSLTSRRKQRALFANKVVQETSLSASITNHLVLEGGVYGGAADNITALEFDVGMTETTVDERQSTINEVLIPGYETNITTTPEAPVITGITSASQTVTVTFTQIQPVSPITNYEFSLNNGGTYTFFSPAVTAGPVTFSGLTNGQAYPVKLRATNKNGTSYASNMLTATPSNRPDAPTAVSAAITGFGIASISFTPPANTGGLPIDLYTVTSSPGGLVGTGVSSPITVSGLTYGTPYTFTVVATNTTGTSVASSASSPVTPTPPPSAPVITSVSLATSFLIVNFTQSLANGALSPTNYQFSTDGGVTFAALSPADTSSPVTITTTSATGSALAANTTYGIQLRAVNALGLGTASATTSSKTKTTTRYAYFSTVSTTSWVSPADTNCVQYLVVAGGGGGGGTYTSLSSIGTISLASTTQSGYWLNGDIFNTGINRSTTYAYLYNSNSLVTTPANNFVRLTAVNPFMSTAPAFLSPQGATNPKNLWYTTEMVYTVSSGFPTVINADYNGREFTTANGNNVSGGSGGGAGGQIQYIQSLNVLTVTGNTTYPVLVGDGGAGGTAGPLTDTAGSPGVSSLFASVVARGGSGGSAAHNFNSTMDGFNTGGSGGVSTPITMIGGTGGQGAVSYGGAPSVSTGSAGGTGLSLNFDGLGSQSYGFGGNGGPPNTVLSTISPLNSGQGGSGTGVNLTTTNAAGLKGGSGLVVVKYFTDV